MRISCFNILILSILFLHSANANSLFPDTIFLQEHHPKIDLLKQGFSTSTESDLNPFQIWQRISSKPEKHTDTSIGFTKDIFWIAFTGTNISSNPIEEVIEIDNPQIDYISVYAITLDKATEIFESGDKYIFNERPVNNRNFLFPLHLKAGETINILIKIDKRNSALNLPIYLWSAQKHSEVDYFRNLGYGIYFGFISLCLVYALMAYLFFGKAVYGWYFLWVFGSALYLFTALGFTFQYLYPFTQDFNSRFRVYIEVVNVICFIKFSEYFLKLPEFTPRLRKILNYLLILFIALILSSLVAFNFFERNSLWILPVINSLMLLCIVLLFTSAIASFKKQKTNVVFYFLAFSILLIGFGLITIGEFGWIAVELLPVNPVMIGSGIEIFIFSIALSYQMKKLYDERNDLSLRLAEQQKSMLKSYIEGVEKERVRIGRELHDDIGSRLSSIKRFMTKLNEEEQAQVQIDQLCEDVRTMSHRLAPPALKVAGLKKMVFELGYQTEQSTGLIVDIQFYDFPDNLSEEISSQIYRIIQEAISNVIKHANAKSIDVQFFGHPEELIITLDDDGKGFSDNSNDGIGLQNMKARIESLNGMIEISSKPSKGTSLLFKIPVNL